MLSVEGIDVRYGRVPALRDVSFNVAAGECVGIFGANRAGKSTVARAISRLAPLAGRRISLQGASLANVEAHRVPALGIAHVPEGRQVFPKLTVRENLLLGGVTLSSRAARLRGLELALALFPKLAERRAQRAGTLSGGEQQMLAIGRALMLQPKLLVLDEPSLGLAPIVVGEVYDRIQNICAEGVSVLLVEQNLKLALGLIDKGYVLENGSVVFEGTAQALRSSEKPAEAYLGH